MPRYFLIFFAALLFCSAHILSAQTKKTASRKPPKKEPVALTEQPVYNPLQILGIRPGITLDSLLRIMAAAGAPTREVKEDTLTKSFAALPMRVFLVDSIICRLTYMRMAFLVDGPGRIRRVSITPRESSIAVGASDDVENVLLLYFGQTWGKPELNLEPPVPNFRWRTGNIQVRGFIRRGFPMWVMEG
jgi:hypothetical protein